MDENKELVETMEDYAEELEASFKRLHEGDIVTGTVVAVTDDQVLVDLKYFAQGVIDRENLSNDPDFNMKEEIQPGDLLTATVIQTDDGEGNVVLSRKEANDRMTWEHFRQLLDERTPLEVTISEVVNGGAVAMVEGVRGFIPASPKYLSSVVKEVSGKTAARWIDESVILEAKALLKYSGMSIQEIAYHLNFSTQSFFGKYFKQHTGTSPSRYKRKG